ncbi:hypothetical protein HanRHA438_Chr16g0786831 [Helianthus annuus]|nr:hypothetical protein HanXRQr2_Chr16g0776021 [Helianthus annuus]KAJ0440114.1 hypothetical protein HanHA300_Chr16g0632831 [Helianthus annuus]KAJ0445411.1 hypothetical protein HanIR_Chr16g0842591 [Helianthus annuus]KAJ0462496.1 hypothetical protein HanHA89_Chr16g0684011 [Helianthus annuus]KAJ0642896.1 hypothetical protein HanLR1_Chr16g0643421 [Helianthus annuus]
MDLSNPNNTNDTNNPNNLPQPRGHPLIRCGRLHNFLLQATIKFLMRSTNSLKPRPLTRSRNSLKPRILTRSRNSLKPRNLLVYFNFNKSNFNNNISNNLKRSNKAKVGLLIRKSNRNRHPIPLR